LRSVYKRICLLAILVAAAGSSPAAPDLAGHWLMNLQVQSSNGEYQIGEAGLLILHQNGSKVTGRAALGDRSDGLVEGRFKRGHADLTLTFSADQPSVVMMLGVDQSGEGLAGRFSAATSDGGVYRGSFSAHPQAAGSVDTPSWQDRPTRRERMSPEYISRFVTYATPTSTVMDDPEYHYKQQQGSMVRKTYVIKYDRNSLLMVRNKPFLHQWWL